MSKLFTYSIFALSLMLIVGCNKSLSSTDLAWNPYKKGDKLHFKSDDGTQQMVEVCQIERNSVRVNPYAGNLSATRENLLVMACHDGPQASGEDFPLLAIGRKSDGGRFINFIFKLPDQIEANVTMDLSEANKLPKNNVQVNGITYKDVLVLQPNVNVGSGVSIPTVSKLYWSKAHGYIKYKLSDGSVWTLTD